MCDILRELKGIESKPVSRSFDNYEKIPGVLDEVSKILQENDNVVITPKNRQRLFHAVQQLNKKVTRR